MFFFKKIYKIFKKIFNKKEKQNKKSKKTKGKPDAIQRHPHRCQRCAPEHGWHGATLSWTKTYLLKSISFDFNFVRDFVVHSNSTQKKRKKGHKILFTSMTWFVSFVCLYFFSFAIYFIDCFSLCWEFKLYFFFSRETFDYYFFVWLDVIFILFLFEIFFFLSYF